MTSVSRPYKTGTAWIESTQIRQFSLWPGGSLDHGLRFYVFLILFLSINKIWHQMSQKSGKIQKMSCLKFVQTFLSSNLLRLMSMCMLLYTHVLLCFYNQMLNICQNKFLKGFFTFFTWRENLMRFSKYGFKLNIFP
jgi:hypothetical protein